MYSLDNEFVDGHGLVNSRKDESNGENSFLWTVELYFLMKERDLDTRQIESSLDKALEKMKIGQGLYKQNPAYPHPKEHGTKEAYMSHDQMTAILTYCKATGKQEIIDNITAEMFSQWVVIYDNKDPEDPSIERVMHPRDFPYYYILSSSRVKKILGLILFPIVLGATAWTFATDEKCRNGVCFQKTDGELLYYVKRSATPWLFAPVNWFANLMIKKRFGSWSRVWSTYFGNEGHPNREITSE